MSLYIYIVLVSKGNEGFLDGVSFVGRGLNVDSIVGSKVGWHDGKLLASVNGADVGSEVGFVEGSSVG